MSQLDVVNMWACFSNEGWSRMVPGSHDKVYKVAYDRFSHKRQDVMYDFSCECHAYQFGNGKHCKHILAVKAQHCGWNQQYDGGDVVDGMCPKCGGAVYGIRVGV